VRGRYTRQEVARIAGVEEGRLAYWERLRLLRPEARCGRVLYSFQDLVLLQSIRQLTREKVPAVRLKRTLEAFERMWGEPPPRSTLGLRRLGSRVVVMCPQAQRIEPLSGQYVLALEKAGAKEKLFPLECATAEEWFEAAMRADSQRETLPQAVEAYRRAIELAPGWTAAHINLGTALYQLADLQGARAAFEAALATEPSSPTAHFNLGCLMDDLGRTEQAITHFQQAVAIDPRHADAHFNLALALEKRGLLRRAQPHWQEYLQLSPRGPWASYARARLRRAGEPEPPIPFPSRHTEN
jgi:tetratricopeptide (TPR) repeat protein